MQDIIAILTDFSFSIGMNLSMSNVFVAFSCFYLIIYSVYFLIWVVGEFVSFHLYFFENGQAYLSSSFDTRFTRRRIEKKYNLKIVQSYSSRSKDLIFMKFSRVDIVNFMKFKDYGGADNGSL